MNGSQSRSSVAFLKIGIQQGSCSRIWPPVSYLYTWAQWAMMATLFFRAMLTTYFSVLSTGICATIYHYYVDITVG